MKSIIKTISLLAVIAFTLTGCSEAAEPNVNVDLEENSASTVGSTVSEVNETTANTTNSKENSTSTTTSTSTTNSTTSPSTTISTTKNEVIEEPTPITTPTTTSNPIITTEKKENPVVTTTTTTTSKSSEHTHSYSEATCLDPATCIICGATKGTTTDHVYSNNYCIYCGKFYDEGHNCSRDGHVYKEYTKVNEETVEIEEWHDVSGCGYDFTLANKIFGRTTHDVDFSMTFGMGFGSSAVPVKTTGIRTVTEYYHECTECGLTEVYKTEETVVPNDNSWEFVYPEECPNGLFTLIWYDIENIPNQVWEDMEKEKELREEWENSLP